MNKLIYRHGREQKKPLAGFTLIEIMVVVMIIGMLVAIVAPRIMDRFRKAQRQAAAAQISSLVGALNNYYMDNKVYPTTEQGLQALVQKPNSNPVPKNYAANGYLDGTVVPKDPWKNDYIYQCPGQNNQPFTIISNGAEGQPGGEGDNADIDSGNLGGE